MMKPMIQLDPPMRPSLMKTTAMMMMMMMMRDGMLLTRAVVDGTGSTRMDELLQLMEVMEMEVMDLQMMPDPMQLSW